MPVIVSPGFRLPADVDPVVSPDGRLTVILDAAHAGALLRADYSDDNSVIKVRFERSDSTIVRSGDPAWAPGGWAHAYDHEATLGGGTSWRAVPILADGTEGTPSDYVTAAIPALADGHVWLKPVHAPDLALKLPLQPQDFDYATRTDATPIAGSRYPTATWDVLQAPTSQITVITRDRQTEKALLRLLDQGPILGQWPACAGVDDHYFLPDKIASEELHWDGYPMRRWTIGTITIARPATVRSPLMIPGLSYDTVARDYDTYDQVVEQVESYNRLLEVT